MNEISSKIYIDSASQVEIPSIKTKFYHKPNSTHIAKLLQKKPLSCTLKVYSIITYNV